MDLSNTNQGLREIEKEDPAIVTKSLANDFNEFIVKLSSQSSTHANAEATNPVDNNEDNMETLNADHVEPARADNPVTMKATMISEVDTVAYTSLGWEDPNVHGIKEVGTKSFVAAVATEKMSTKVNFRVLFNNETVEDTNFVLPVENVMVARNKFANSLVGFFVRKSMAFQLVQNYVTNT
ncbi:hypothetical protein Tco_0343130 [Tanacetum coccineum]